MHFLQLQMMILVCEYLSSRYCEGQMPRYSIRQRKRELLCVSLSLHPTKGVNPFVANFAAENANFFRKLLRVRERVF